MDNSKAIARVIMGQTQSVDDPDEIPPRLFEAKIKAVQADGMIKFIVPNWDGGKYEFGPVPYALWTTQSALSGDYAHVHEMLGPKVGDVCLVAFVGGNGDIDAQSPWVLGWRSA